MFPAARVTPLPKQRFGSPSRNSSASRDPVDAPDGAAPNPRAPSARTTSAATVALPRESIISKPVTWSILAIGGSDGGDAKKIGCARCAERHPGADQNRVALLGEFLCDSTPACMLDHFSDIGDVRRLHRMHAPDQGKATGRRETGRHAEDRR